MATTNHRALLISLLMAAISVALLLVYLRQFEEATSGGERVKLLVALKPIARGTLISEDMLSSREVPPAYVEARAIKASERSKVLGVRAGLDIEPQELMLWTDLAVAMEERDLSSRVQPGNRAVSVRAGNGDESKGNALIRPGDYVDVLATMAEPNKPSMESRAAVVLLQRILVLAVGLDTTSPASGQAEPKQRSTSQRDVLLTLSLNLQEAQMLALASEKGRLSVALRNPEDQRVQEGLPDMALDSVLDNKARTEIQNVRRSANTAVASGPVRVESAGAVR